MIFGECERDRGLNVLLVDIRDGFGLIRELVERGHQLGVMVAKVFECLLELFVLQFLV